MTFLVVTLSAYFLASAAAQLAARPGLPMLPEPMEAQEQTAQGVSIPPLAAFNAITDRNLFKAALPPKPKPKPPPKPPGIDKLPVANLGKVKLLGTVLSDVPAWSRAVTLEGSEQKLLKVGDAIAGFKIIEIQRRAVVLQQGNQQQLLLIDVADKPIAAKQGEARAMLSRAELKAKAQDLDALARDIQFAVAKRGNQEGLWVRQLRAGSVFSKAGLQKDDVILAVGGQSVTQNVNPLQMFKLLDRDQVPVDLLRDGKPMKLLLILTGK
ncbi:MAG: PDZ domain-containing protein [Desulfovibrionaceae bacterium]